MIDYDNICRVARFRASQKRGTDWRDLAQETALPMLDLIWRQTGSRREVPVVSVPLSDDMMSETETKAAIIMPRMQSAIDSLPFRWRKVLRLYYWQDLSMREIAEQMAVNQPRVSQIHAAAINKIRKTIQ